MVSYHRDKIKLQEAMTMELSYETRVWIVLGLQVEVKDIPKNSTVKKTSVLMSHGKSGVVGIEVKIKEKMGWRYIMRDVAVFSSLEELQKKFPKLFELEGNLIAFS